MKRKSMRIADANLPAQCCSSTRASQLFTLQPTLPTFQEREREESFEVATKCLAVMKCTFKIKLKNIRYIETHVPGPPRCRKQAGWCRQERCLVLPARSFLHMATVGWTASRSN